MAGYRPDPGERLPPPRSIHRLRCRAPLRRRNHSGRRTARVHRRASHARSEEAGRLPRLRHPLHARASTGRLHGFKRRRLRRILRLPPPHRPGGGGMTTFTCPAPIAANDTILLGHGSGGKLSAGLLRDIFLPAFANPLLSRLEDQAVFEIAGARLAFTTDSFVVKPLFFRGGDIGSLAVHGTVNDLAMGGARPLALSAAFILEEGFALADLKRVVDSMAKAAARAGVSIVTGDTKVVERGSGDGVYINTAGIGLVAEGVNLSASNARPGDAVILSGAIGDHGAAILTHREGLELDGAIASDSAPLHDLVDA